MEYYLTELEKEGVTYVPRWKPAVKGDLSAGRAVPKSGAIDGLPGKDLVNPTELMACPADGQ